MGKQLTRLITTDLSEKKMDHRDRLALELTKALIIAKPELLDSDDGDALLHCIDRATTIFIATSDHLEERIDDSFFSD